ncbi:MAG: 1,4-dihydroxy-2-naphthoate polyprenyltransferase, partial [uncultured Solirubrobacteraceae bacterium]
GPGDGLGVVEDLAHGQPRADAARGGRARARGDRAGRDVRHLPGRRVRRGAARRAVHPGRHEPLQRLLRRPARSGHGGPPRARPGHRGRARAAEAGAAGDLRLLQPGGRLRDLPRGDERRRTARHRRALDPRRCAVHGRSAALRLRGARRGLRLSLLRGRRRRGLDVRPARDVPRGGLRPGGARRPARRSDPGRQQRPRPRHGPARRQADACRAPRAIADPDDVRGDGLRRLSHRAAGDLRPPARAVALPALAHPAAGREARAHGAQSLRRADAQRRAGALGPVAARLLRAPCRRHPGLL